MLIGGEAGDGVHLVQIQRAVSPAMRKVDARHAGAVDARNAWIAAPDLAACASVSGAGMSIFEPSSRYFAS
jgi:hypothetical protein